MVDFCCYDFCLVGKFCWCNFGLVDDLCCCDFCPVGDFCCRVFFFPGQGLGLGFSLSGPLWGFGGPGVVRERSADLIVESIWPHPRFLSTNFEAFAQGNSKGTGI